MSTTGTPGTATSSAIVANGLVFAAIACATLLIAYDPDVYYRVVQEDGFLEWTTFWTFLLAAVLSIVAAVRQHRNNRSLPWFFAGVCLFCLFVALEEISWGQRMLGYRPPVYFLEQNYQQEFNLHNVVDTRLRKFALSAVIVGYGVVLPVLQRLPVCERLFARIGVIPPPIGLLPTFLAAYILYEWYPWTHTGEWVESFLGLGFLFATLAAARHYRTEFAGTGGVYLRVGHSLAATGAVVVLGFTTAAATSRERSAHPDIIAALETELRALKEDFENGRAEPSCNMHKRLFTFVVEYDQWDLFDGSYAALQAQELPEERAEFFLDPWNSPYWLRDRCNEQSGERITFVYSFGANRRRDSTRTEIRDDDIGAYIATK